MINHKSNCSSSKFARAPALYIDFKFNITWTRKHDFNCTISFGKWKKYSLTWRPRTIFVGSPRIFYFEGQWRLRGGGVQPKFYVKLNFEIAVDQKGGTQDQIWGGSEHPVPNIVHRVATPNFGPKISNSPYKVKTKQMGALLVATDVLSTRISFFSNWTKNDWVMSQNAMPIYGRDRQIS